MTGAFLETQSPKNTSARSRLAIADLLNPVAAVDHARRSANGARIHRACNERRALQ